MKLKSNQDHDENHYIWQYQMYKQVLDICKKQEKGPNCCKTALEHQDKVYTDSLYKVNLCT